MSTPSSASRSRPSTSRTSVKDPFASPPSSSHSSIRPATANSSKSVPTSSTSHVPPPSINLPTANASARFSAAATSAYSIRPASSTATPLKKLPRMRSHMLPEGQEVPKPWTDKPSSRHSIAYYLTYFMIFLATAGGAVQTYFSFKNVQLDHKPLCIVLDENFDNPDQVFGPNGTFFREVNMDGFGTGEFEMTTSSTNNSFVKDGMLYIVPTLTSDNIGSDAVFNGTIYNITDCTFNTTQPNNGFITRNGKSVFDIDGYTRACSAVSNATAGSIINPVQSARISTKFSASIRYGKIEVRAKMPSGDWMWPAIWMLPRDSVYGPWPLSGEIDIVESRGNGIRYTARGSNFVQGSLNWGPAEGLDGVDKSFSWWTNKRKSFSDDFHTYSLEWTDTFLRISVDTRLHTLLDMPFKEPFFKLGDFPQVIFNGSSLVALQNPWINGTNATPFDQEFYLIMNIAVGSTNGWFPDGQGNKPWLNQAQNPMLDFAKAESQWYPTWPSNAFDRGMVVDYVRMWKHCDGS
ncbi:Beta-1,3-glucan-binding protein [Termitomyces sp. T112]|nr:Beta-1,3-glucan-binding protein [Termitomyces sp. T112]